MNKFSQTQFLVETVGMKNTSLGLDGGYWAVSGHKREHQRAQRTEDLQANWEENVQKRREKQNRMPRAPVSEATRQKMKDQNQKKRYFHFLLNSKAHKHNNTHI
jgi:hypothetical protein